MRVAVTAKDIHDGERGSSERCPLALALRRQTGKRWEVHRRTCFDVEAPGVVVLPEAVATWIRRYDRGWSVEPFSVTLAA